MKMCLRCDWPILVHLPLKPYCRIYSEHVNIAAVIFKPYFPKFSRSRAFYYDKKENKCHWLSFTSKAPGVRKEMDFRYDLYEKKVYCYNGTGEDYRGHLSKTRSGFPCAVWDESLKSKSWTLSEPSMAGLQKNYCRNPDKDKHGLWCFTNNPSIPWDYCDLKRSMTIGVVDHYIPDLTEYSVWLGFLHLNEAGREVSSKQVLRISHLVCGPQGSDLVLLKLSGPAWQTEHVRIIQLPVAGCVIKENTYCTVYGWGETKGTGYDGMMKAVKLPIVGNKICNEYHKGRITVTESEVCAGGKKDEGVCEGSDLVLLKLSGPAWQTEHVRIIQLPVAGCVIKENTYCTVYGWGETKGTGYDGMMKAVKLPIVGNKICNEYHKGRITVTESEVCAGGKKDEGVCEKDYGGPLVCEEHDVKVVQGVSVHGRGCGRPNRPGIFVSIPYYTDWIHKVFKIL
ncbi:UNVERIFIED_CONTAM: hypothetical protein FKN15_076370 [Acipenser sinensis]